MRTQIGVLEQSVGEKRVRSLTTTLTRLCQRLQSSGEVGGLAHRGLGDGGVALAGFAHHHQAGVDADSGATAGSVPLGWRRASTTSKPARIARTASSSCARGQPKYTIKPIAQILGHMPVVPRDHLATGTLVGLHQIAQFFRVEPSASAVEPTRSQNITVS